MKYYNRTKEIDELNYTIAFLAQHTRWSILNSYLIRPYCGILQINHYTSAIPKALCITSQHRKVSKI